MRIASWPFEEQAQFTSAAAVLWLVSSYHQLQPLLALQQKVISLTGPAMHALSCQAPTRWGACA